MFHRIKKRFLLDRPKRLSQWRENSFFIVMGAVSLAALPALFASTAQAFRDQSWGLLSGFTIGYLVWLLITVCNTIPFKARAWTGVFILLALGTLSVLAVGPVGSGRIWLFTAAFFTALVLGTRQAVAVLVFEVLVLALYYLLLKQNFEGWARLSEYHADSWITTSVTLVFLSVVCISAMGALIQGISVSLEESRHKSAQLDEKGRLLARKVAEHDQTIAHLKESEQRWHFALEGAGDGVWDWDLKADAIYFSPRWKQVTGFDRDDIANDIQQWFDRIHPHDRERVENQVIRLISNGEDLLKVRYRMRCRDASYKWMLDRGRVMERDSSGRALRIIGTHADISALKALEEQQADYESRLRQAQKMEAIGTLAGGIAHDFNNILFPILGHAEMLIEEARADGSTDPGTLESLEQVQASAMRARELVKQILAFSRQEEVQCQPLRIQVVLKEVVKLLRATLPSSIEIVQSIEPDLDAVLADATQVHQIIMNLATNAYHAMGEAGGRLTLALYARQLADVDVEGLAIRPGRVVCLSVSDTGSGMTRDMINKIFDPFFTTKEKGKGTGMGLAVVHGIVQKMDGAVHVYSEPGRGTEFKLFFPVIESRPQRVSAGAIGKNLYLGTEHILMVDDEEAVLSLEKKALERLGYRVSAFAGPQAALSAFKTDPDGYDLVLTDMAMPGMSGTLLARHLVEIRPDIPVVLCTGFSENMTEETVAIHEGVRAVVMKPVVLKEMAQKIRSLLDPAPHQ